MMVEFEKRIFHLNQEITSLKTSRHNTPERLARLEGALEEVERLYGFYKNQMAVKGGGHEESISHGGNTGTGNNGVG